MKINGKIKLLIGVLVVAGCAFGGWRYYTDRLLTPEERAQVYSEQFRMDELPPQVVQRLRNK